MLNCLFFLKKVGILLYFKADATHHFMQSNLINVFVTELQNVQDNSGATTLSDDHADLTSQGMAKIADALVRKIKNKTEDCPNC